MGSVFQRPGAIGEPIGEPIGERVGEPVGFNDALVTKTRLKVLASGS